MSYVKRIVCLANSYKTGGLCIAGREMVQNGVGGWIRPVTGMERGVLNYERFCSNSNGRDPRLLDLIAIEFLVPQPHPYQTENHRIDPCKRWVHRGHVRWQQLVDAVERPTGPLWANDDSSRNGVNDVVSEQHALVLQRSLILVQPEELILTISIENKGGFGEMRRRIRGELSLANCRYVLSVTDSRIEHEFSTCGPREERLYRKPILCVSLSEILASQRACYKLIAGVIPTGM